MNYPSGNTYYSYSDWLGTKRYETDSSGAYTNSWASLPYGDSQTALSTGLDATEHHFTGKEHDAESGLDYFGARYYQEQTGRWMLPDWSAVPVPVPYAAFNNPQTLNLYTYVGNNPVNEVDADGHSPHGTSISPGENGSSLWGEIGCGGLEQGYSSLEGGVCVVDDGALPPQQLVALQAYVQQVSDSDQAQQQSGPFVADTSSPEYIRDSTTLADNATWGLIGSGECVAATEHFTGVPGPTADWTTGTAPVKVVNADGTINSAVKPGTAIMTPNSSGGYPQSNSVPKNSATFVGPGKYPGSIQVIDQWNAHPEINSPAHPPSMRTIFLDNTQSVSNNSNAYYVIFLAR